MDIAEIITKYTVQKQAGPRAPTVQRVAVAPRVINGIPQLLSYLSDLTKRIEALETEVKELRALVTPVK